MSRCSRLGQLIPRTDTLALRRRSAFLLSVVKMSLRRFNRSSLARGLHPLTSCSRATGIGRAKQLFGRLSVVLEKGRIRVPRSSEYTDERRSRCPIPNTVLAPHHDHRWRFLHFKKFQILVIPGFL